MCIRDSAKTVANLRAASVSGNPVPIYTIGYGADADATALKAVSYTHLDVYKRQVPGLRRVARP